MNEFDDIANADSLAIEVMTQVEGEQAEEFESGPLVTNLARTIRERFEESSRHRDGDEQRWIQAYQNYRGHYSKNMRFTETEKSKVFVKVTKTKVLAAYGQLIDVLFGTDKFPISVKSTEIPEGSAKLVHYKIDGAPPIEAEGIPDANVDILPEEMNPYNVGWAGDGLQIQPGAKFNDVVAGIRRELLGENRENEQNFVKGPSLQGEPELQPAKDAARRMEMLIHDQITESNGHQELRSALFEAALLGTGIIKGPFTIEKTLHRWTYDPKTKQRTYNPEKVKVPRIEFCSVWDAFPDPNARNTTELEWFIQRHKMSRSQLRALKNRPFFNRQKIDEVLDLPPNYNPEDYETQIVAENSNVMPATDRYEVLEYWGIVDKKDLEDYGVALSEEYSNLDEIQINAWICGSKLLRVVVNPFTPKRIPYLAFDYERNPYSFFGIGVAENMSDSQMIMNGHVRMAIDNLALAGNMVLDVDENALVPGQSMEVYPGKIFKRQAGQPGQAIFGVKFPNTAPENMQIFDKFRQLADEATGIPSYAHGQTGVMSTTRTASGMSMLMGAASLNIKTVVKNIDDFLLKPLGEAMFQWNMAFYEGDLDIVGDLEVEAGGASSLMKNEIRSQRLTAFGQLLANPAVAPFVKIPAYVKAFVESLELDPEELVNDQNEAAIYASIMGMAGGAKGGLSPEMGGGMGEIGAIPPAAMPGEPGFSGTEQPLPEEALDMEQ